LESHLGLHSLMERNLELAMELQRHLDSMKEQSKACYSLTEMNLDSHLGFHSLMEKNMDPTTEIH
jgi:hypothetical protein